MLTTMKKKPKILYLITKSNYGGAQKYVFELASAAKRAGLEVTVACGGTGEQKAITGLLVEKLEAKSIPVFVIKHFVRDMSFGDDLRSFFEILSVLRKYKPDVLHLSSSKASGLGAVAGRIMGIKTIVFTVHGFPDDETWRPKYQQFLISLLTRVTCYLSHKIIAISSDSYERLLKIVSRDDKVVLIKNGVSLVDFTPKAEVRQNLIPILTTNNLVIGGIGELHPNKNWSLLLHALTTLPKHIHVCIIGEGDERNQLELLADKLQIRERVHLVGYLENAAKQLLLFDLFILPSKKEGLPYVILEAGLASLPVIATSLPGTKDIIETGMSGILVEQTANQLTTSIQFLLRDEGLRRRLGQELHEKVLADFSLARMATDTISVYSSMIPSETGRTSA